MRRSIRLGVGTAVVAAALAVGAGPAMADAGAPGTTFPEQPNGNVSKGCAAILTNPGQSVLHFSDTAEGIITGLTVDACFGG
jgi:hypothetical protein